MKKAWLNACLIDVQVMLDTIRVRLNDYRLKAQEEENPKKNVSGIRGSTRIYAAMGHLKKAIDELEKAINKGGHEE